jgi:hypothetical protein
MTKTKVEIVSPGDGYDPQKHITAGELRQVGITIPEHVPDCAWTPRHAISFGEVAVDRGTDPDVMNVSVDVELGRPFLWTRVEVEVDAPAEEIVKTLRGER